MSDGATLKVTTPSDREIAMSRAFDAPRRLVFDAWTKPELLKRWLGAFGSWSLAVCEIDLQVGGSYRYVWRNADGREMGMGGVYREIVRPERIVTTEKFDESWYPGEAVVTIALSQQGSRTVATTTVLYETREARDIALNSGMKDGVAMSYDKLAEILASMPAE